MRRLDGVCAKDRSAVEADAGDDRLISHGEAAQVILGLQDRETRDHAAEWMEGPEAESALRLWRALARRCVGGYAEHAAAPLALAGWVAWSTGDEPAARVALGLALRTDPRYVFAQLLHQACNEGLDPEALRTCLREERGSRATAVSRKAGNRARSRSAGRPARQKALPSRAKRPGTPAGRDRASSRTGQRGTRSGR
jgi:hypothetical protein